MSVIANTLQTFTILQNRYCIVQVFDTSQLDHQNLTSQFFKIITAFTDAWLKPVTI